MTRWFAVPTMMVTTLAAMVAACSGSSANIADPTSEDAAVTTTPDGASPEPDAASPDGAVVVTPDGGGSDGAPADGGLDAAKPKPPAPPAPGDACTNEMGVFTKGCGQCGRRSALCLDGKVTDYAACEQENPSCILASETVGQQASNTYLLETTGFGRLDGTCPNATTTTPGNRNAAFIEIGNTSDKTITATVWATNNGGPPKRLALAWYATRTSSSSGKAAIAACTKGVAVTCPAGLACSDTQAGLTGGDSIVIPPYMGQVTVYVGAFESFSAGEPRTVRLVVRTDAAN